MTHPLACPWCRCALAAVSPHCPGCAADLRPLVQVADLADRHFNAAVRAARAGDWHRAAEQVAVTLALHPEDLDAVVLLAKISRRQGRRERSRQLWERALELAPHRPDIQRAVELSSQPVPPWQRLLDLAPGQQQIAAAAPSRQEVAAALRKVVAADSPVRRVLAGFAQWTAKR
jgi:tetratricopeptide (TPR) repeat protein